MKKKNFDGGGEGMNRRQLLGAGAALVGGALVGTSLSAPKALAQENAAYGGATSEGSGRSSTPLNLYPPVVEVQGGKLRGFRDGRTTVFLGIPYAEADRFELPKPVQPWKGVKSAQAWARSVRS